MNNVLKIVLGAITFVIFLFGGISVNAQTVVTENLPFKVTNIEDGRFAASTHWYTLTIRANKMVMAAEPQLLCANADIVLPEHLWCFVAEENGKFSIYNFAYGTNHKACSSSTSNGEPVVMKKSGDIENAASSFVLIKNSSGGYSIACSGHQQSAWNDYRGNGIISIWDNQNSNKDLGSNIVFDEYDASDFVQEEEEETPTLLPVTSNILYVYTKQNIVDAFPVELIKSSEDDGKHITITDKNDGIHSYRSKDVDSLSNVAPNCFAAIESFKFNNKFNDMLMVDAVGEIDETDTITVKVGSIGKRLIPSIKVSEEDAMLYVGNQRQNSKHSSHRFEEPIVYTVSKTGYSMLREQSDGELLFCPYGRDYVVIVDYLCDHPTTEYGIPVIRINTNDGNIIASRDVYVDAMIEIDGAGYFPDLPETGVRIKGRGNTSWDKNLNANPKNPYHIKFATKQKPLGMKAGKSWNLIANAIKGSMTTNVIGSRAAEMVGCAGANHFLPVELYINGDYRGSYTITENVGLSNNSIDLDDESRAVLLELDTYYDEAYRFRTADYNLPVNVNSPDFSDEESTELTLAQVESHFNSFVSALKRGEDINKYVDVESLARYLMLNELILNREIFHPKSMFCYNSDILSDSCRYVFGPAWDFDWAFGYESVRDYFTHDQQMDFWTKTSFAGKDFIYTLRYNSGEDMNRAYYRVWTDFYENHLSELQEYCSDYYDVAAKSFEHDNSKWGSGGANAYQTLTIKGNNWLSKRTKYVYDYLSDYLGYADKGYLDEEPEENEPSDIADVSNGVQTTVLGTYDLSGRRITTDFSLLPRGVYIVNGRKIIKR